ncbi:ATP synthase F1 subunit delta [Niabella beijingensis]|uniref:ATP synthase F1 subunit delta n=1 Tax=Niabella beijingensis TaxID=2872700 RepID=UPI001CBC4A6F|nr:ATP synthase F1 subunit delta [Niabella beijingensis]MBZ4189023.1 ATP synthase F1 subunit delta [Niabella beijingensis]
MPNPRLASRYAKALLDLAKEKDQVEQVFADVQWLQALCGQSRDFVNLLRSPIIKADKKKSIVNAIAGTHIGEITKGFANLLISKNRESILPEILPAFIEQYKVLNNIHTVKLTTAVPVGDAVKNNIINQVKAASGQQKIELEATVNPDIIGGFVLEMGDKMVDASVSYDLKAIAKQFKNNDFIYKVR